MKKISADLIRKVRNKTGAPIMRVKSVLEEFNGDEKKAEKKLMKEGFDKITKKKDRETSQGLVVVYEHHSGKVGSMVEVLCETDFVARNKLFVKFARDLAMQIASMNPKNEKELENQDFIKDPSKKISDLVKELIMKTGENIKIGRFSRIELGEK